MSNHASPFYSFVMRGLRLICFSHPRATYGLLFLKTVPFFSLKKIIFIFSPFCYLLNYFREVLQPGDDDCPTFASFWQLTSERSLCRICNYQLACHGHAITISYPILNCMRNKDLALFRFSATYIFLCTCMNQKEKKKIWLSFGQDELLLIFICFKSAINV